MKIAADIMSEFFKKNSIHEKDVHCIGIFQCFYCINIFILVIYYLIKNAGFSLGEFIKTTYLVFKFYSIILIRCAHVLYILQDIFSEI